MNLFDLIPFAARFRRLPKPRSDGKLACDKCKGSIHRHDRYQIVAVRHIDCRDPRLVGQKSLPLLQSPAAPDLLAGQPSEPIAPVPTETES
jgi:hypothetical protein